MDGASCFRVILQFRMCSMYCVRNDTNHSWKLKILLIFYNNIQSKLCMPCVSGEMSAESRGRICLGIMD